MVENLIRDALRTKLTAPVYTVLPDKIPKVYVRIVRSAHYIENYVHHATVTIWSVAGSLYLAAELDEAVQRAMEEIYEEDVVDGMSLENNYNDTDNDLREYKYRSEYDLTY